MRISSMTNQIPHEIRIKFRNMIKDHRDSLILEALNRCRGRVGEAARDLGVHRNTVTNAIRRILEWQENRKS